MQSSSGAGHDWSNGGNGFAFFGETGMTAKIESLAARRARELAKRSGTDRAGGRADASGKGKSSARPCPICGAPRSDEYRPFCSRRCADIDLGRWLKEDYRVPSQEPADRPEEDTED